MPWDQGLEGPSLHIAASDHSPLRVRAGPGTGKTFTLIKRIARLLENGTRPRRILVTTFTRNAANDLKQELERLDVEGAASVRATTVHALCFSILARNEVLEITGRVPRPLLEYEQRFLLQDLQDGQFGNIHARRRRLKAFEAAWARLQSEQPGWPQDPVDQRFHQQLLYWLRFHDAMLIGELVPEALRYLRNNPASPELHAALEEQRRLFYVSITRAREVLVLSSVTDLPRDRAYRMGVAVRGHGNTVRTIASRFIDELGPTRPAPVSGRQLLRQGEVARA